MRRIHAIFLCLLMCLAIFDFHTARAAIVRGGPAEPTVGAVRKESADHQSLMATGASGLERVCSPMARRMMPKLLPAMFAPSTEHVVLVATGPRFLARDILPRPPSTTTTLPLLN